MEVFFLDVAQGMCHIMLVGDQTAIVIDSGSGAKTKQSTIPLQFLQRMGIKKIAALLTTHSHKDHMGGAVNILGHYQDQIARIGFVDDGTFRTSPYWVRISEFINEGKLDRDCLIRLECSSIPQVVWENSSLNAKFQVIAPLPIQNLQATEQETPNATSAVLVLDIGTKRIVFAGDSEFIEWKDIHREHGTLHCNLLSVSHHGGDIKCSQDELAWLYRDAVKPEVAIISVGTTNTHHHPREDVVRALTECGAKVMCTQITKQCNNDLEFVRSISLPKRYDGASSETKCLTRSSGNSKNVACAGTIRVEIDERSVKVESLIAHQALVDQIQSPLCRLG